MEVLQSVAFPDKKVVAVRLGGNPDLCWWVTAADPARRKMILKAAKRRDGALEVFGTAALRGPRVAARFALDGSLLLAVSGNVLHILSSAWPGAAAVTHELPDDSVTDLSSLAGRVIYLARSLAWPPIWALDTDSSQITGLEPARDNVSKHFPQLALSSDGRHLAFGHVFDSIEVFDLQTGGKWFWPRASEHVSNRQLSTSDLIASLRFTFDGRHLTALSQPRDKGAVEKLRIGPLLGEDVREYPLSSYLPVVSVGSGGRLAAASRRDQPGRVDVFELGTNSVVESLETGSRAMDLALVLDRSKLTVLSAKGLLVAGLKDL